MVSVNVNVNVVNSGSKIGYEEWMVGRELAVEEI